MQSTIFPWGNKYYAEILHLFLFFLHASIVHKLGSDPTQSKLCSCIATRPIATGIQEHNTAIRQEGVSLLGCPIDWTPVGEGGFMNLASNGISTIPWPHQGSKIEYVSNRMQFTSGFSVRGFAIFKAKFVSYGKWLQVRQEAGVADTNFRITKSCL